jgi:hypothetical protein
MLLGSFGPVLLGSFEPPVDIGRADAQREAAEELLRSGYKQESLVDLVWRKFSEFLGDLLDATSGGVGGGVISLIVIAVILALLGALLLWSLRRMSRGSRGPEDAMFGEQERTAAEHRSAAERLAAAGDWAAAIQERLPAIARDLEERAIVSPLPGRTAAELADVAGQALPSHAAGLGAAARLFDDITYGEARGTAEGYATLTRLDERLRATRVALEASL